MAYADELLMSPRGRRRAALRQTFLFDCACVRCHASESEAAEVERERQHSELLRDGSPSAVMNASRMYEAVGLWPTARGAMLLWSGASSTSDVGEMRRAASALAMCWGEDHDAVRMMRRRIGAAAR